MASTNEEKTAKYFYGWGSVHQEDVLGHLVLGIHTEACCHSGVRVGSSTLTDASYYTN